MFRYSEILEFRGTPHWTPINIVGLQANTELEKSEFWSVRDQQREPAVLHRLPRRQLEEILSHRHPSYFSRRKVPRRLRKIHQRLRHMLDQSLRIGSLLSHTLSQAKLKSGHGLHGFTRIIQNNL